ncbi:MAG: TRAP-type C4-dicarboxylate transport system, small permease component [Deltaproteobacteria bacterium]|nr:TRAP-type C4-dicarboxylate transport system, small permease component [Deltaproteobacteria bacterium]
MDHPKNSLSSFCTWINQKVIGLTAILLFLMLIFSIIAIFWRYVLNNSITWAEDVLLPCFVWVGLLGISVAFRSKSHINVESVLKLMPSRLARILSLIVEIMITIFSGYLTLEGMKVTIATKSMPWGMLQLSPSFFYVAFPICFFLITLYGIDAIFTKSFK